MRNTAGVVYRKPVLSAVLESRAVCRTVTLTDGPTSRTRR
jgi:hypothetical protein